MLKRLQGEIRKAILFLGRRSVPSHFSTAGEPPRKMPLVSRFIKNLLNRAIHWSLINFEFQTCRLMIRTFTVGKSSWGKINYLEEAKKIVRYCEWKYVRSSLCT